MESLTREEREHADALIARVHCGDPPAERDALGALAQWAAGHPAREDYARRLGEVDALMSLAAPGLKDRYPRLARRPASRRLGAFAHAGIACAALAIVAAAVWWANPALDDRVLETAVGEQRIVILADGSKVTLNSRTRVAVALRLRSRETRLDQGEALFEVARSSWRPWTTAAGSARVSVLGTVFNVRREGDAVRLTVFEGRVAFDPGSGLDVVIVDAGKAAESRSGMLVSRPATANLAAVGAWREQRMVFDDTPLREAMHEAGRYRRDPIRVDPAIAGLRITGAFPTTDPERLLKLLPDALPVTVVRAADGSVDIRGREDAQGAWQPPAVGRPPG